MHSLKRYKVGVYLRLSSGDESGKESVSIENQRSMLRRYIDTHEDTLVYEGEYVDDDYSGADFRRPGFLKMVQDYKRGIINCILVKDHSRFARNASEMKYYLEHDLDGVRYISKDDQFDSLFSEYDFFFQVKNLFNETYLEDISKKIHSTLDDKQRAGKFTGAFPCFGYAKSLTDKNALVIDGEAAVIVRRIFSMRLQGENVAAIARSLNEEGILSPLEYKWSKGSNFVSPKARCTDGRHLWDFTSVNRILRNQTYAGDLVQGRKRQKLRKKPVAKPKEEWVVAVDAVPPIVSRQDFWAVQELMDTAKHVPEASAKEHIFAGILRCGECGKACVKTRKDQETIYYVCGTRKRNGKAFCDVEYIRHDFLEAMILSDLNTIISQIGDLSALIEGENEEPDCCGTESQIAKLIQERELQTQKKHRHYDNFVDGIISREDFLLYQSLSRRREEDLLRKIQMLQQEAKEHKKCCNPWLENVLTQGKVDVLDRATVREMVSSIRVCKDRKVEITYKFDGMAGDRNEIVEHCTN